MQIPRIVQKLEILMIMVQPGKIIISIIELYLIFLVSSVNLLVYIIIQVNSRQLANNLAATKNSHDDNSPAKENKNFNNGFILVDISDN